MREEMMNRIAEAIKEEFGSGCEVQFKDVAKNNGLVLKAVMIREPGMAGAPIVYIDEVLGRIMSGDVNIREAAQGIVNTYRKRQGKVDLGRKIASRISGQSILENVTYKLINAERNEGWLAGMPHKKFIDLAAIYMVIAGEDKMGISSFLISNWMLERYGLSEEELDTAARQNTERHGFQMVSMNSIYAEIIGESEGKIGCPMYVLTNTRNFNGAAAMLYPEIFKSLADRIGSDLYVLPSSIHEVIVIPDHEEELEKLKSVVGAVNSSVVSEDEFLSGNVYRYSRKENRLEIV